VTPADEDAGEAEQLVHQRDLGELKPAPRLTMFATTAWPNASGSFASVMFEKSKPRAVLEERDHERLGGTSRRTCTARKCEDDHEPAPAQPLHELDERRVHARAR